MKLSLKWLRELVKITVSDAELARLFSLRSSEVEHLDPLVEATNLVVGEVLTCVNHPDSDHLHVCLVDVGTEKLSIVCGAPNVAEGQKVIVALDGAILPGDFKIKKAKIRGVESCGMICSLEELGIDKKFHQEDGIHVLPDSAVVGSDPLAVMGLDGNVLELDLTPNRGDLLSMLGVAYDTKAILDTQLTFTPPKITEIAQKNDMFVASTTPLCLSYYGRVVRDITIASSPDWLKSLLIAGGIRPINNVVDITNYIMLLYGQPLHAFDYDKLARKEVLVRGALAGEKIITLDGKERTLLAEDIVITDGTVPIALAGVMGGIDTEIDVHSNTIFLESAIFDPITIRKTSKRLDLRSEASIRFERGIDPNRTLMALDHACTLFQTLCGGKILAGVSSFDRHDPKERIIVLETQKVASITGVLFTRDQIQAILERLSISSREIRNGLEVVVPTRRGDFQTYQDIIEEIVRIYGYENIPSTLPQGNADGYLTPVQQKRRMIRHTLTDLGLDEVITYSLVTPAQAVAFDAQALPSIRLMYPMAEDRSVLRHSPLPSVLEALKYNLSRQATDLGLFEIGKGYYQTGEKELLVGAMTGIYQESSWQGKHEAVDFFLMKGIVENLLARLDIVDSVFVRPELALPHLHPGISAIIRWGDQTIGWLGKLHPSYVLEAGLPDTFVFELDLSVVLSKESTTILMTELPKYPSINRDLAVVVQQAVTAAMLEDSIKKAGKGLLKDIRIFDLYQGESIAEGSKSIAITLVFRDNAKTLESADVDKAVERIIKALRSELEAQLRT